MLFRSGDRVAIYGRDLDEVTVAFPEIVAAAQAAGLHGIFDGEIVGWSEEGQLPATSVMLRLSGAGTSLMQQGRAPAIFIAFDCLAHGEKSLLDEAYATRRIALETSGIATAGNGTIRLADARVVRLLLLAILLVGLGASTAYLIPWSLLPDAIDADVLEAVAGIPIGAADLRAVRESGQNSIYRASSQHDLFALVNA